MSSSLPVNARRLASLRAERAARNADNVSRTESYLELYREARRVGLELPWVLMAHLVSRNAGLLMTDLGRTLASERSAFSTHALRSLFEMLERANFLIFYDAWRHVTEHALRMIGAPPDDAGRPDEHGFLAPEFVRRAWRDYESGRTASAPTRDEERALVLALVQNEQHLIEHRVVHAPRFEPARAIIRFVEATGHEAPIALPGGGPEVRVGGFAELARRIDAGRRIFDLHLADPSAREDAFVWAQAHPHTGARPLRTGGAGPTLRSLWPIERVRAWFPLIHAPPEPDPTWP